MRKYLWLSVLALTLSSLVGCGVEEYKTTTVEGTVIEKEYEEEKITYKTVTKDGKKIKKKKVESEEYEVDIQYKDIVAEFDDEILYDSVEVGDKIKVTHRQGFNKEGELVVEGIELTK